MVTASAQKAGDRIQAPIQDRIFFLSILNEANRQPLSDLRPKFSIISSVTSEKLMHSYSDDNYVSYRMDKILSRYWVKG